MHQLKSITEKEKYEEVLRIVEPQIFMVSEDFLTYYYLKLDDKYKEELLGKKIYKNKPELLANILRKEPDIYMKAKVLTKLSNNYLISEYLIDFRNIELMFDKMPKVLKEDILENSNWYISLFNKMKVRKSDKERFYISLTHMNKILYSGNLIKQTKSLIDHAEKYNVKPNLIVSAFEKIMEVDDTGKTLKNYLKSKGEYAHLLAFYEKKLIEKDLSGKEKPVIINKKRI